MMVSIRKGKSPTATHVFVGPLHLLFSYETVVAFALNGDWCISENIWSVTTGKHLGQEAPRGVARVSHDEFVERLARALRSLDGPRRDDPAVEFLKRHRDDYDPDRNRHEWEALDNALDEYRLHADTGTPLDEQVDQ